MSHLQSISSLILVLVLLLSGDAIAAPGYEIPPLVPHYSHGQAATSTTVSPPTTTLSTHTILSTSTFTSSSSTVFSSTSAATSSLGGSAISSAATSRSASVLPSKFGSSVAASILPSNISSIPASKPSKAPTTISTSRLYPAYTVPSGDDSNML